MLVQFFGAGKVNVRLSLKRCDYYIQDFSKICEFIIPHFDIYLLHNIKSLDFLDFKRAAEIYKLEGKEGREKISQIILNMNSKRKYE